ncbi:hypothetical protein B0T22DRAFT_441993 [Podospora appendiculata]|uniref:Uncharacterized protein n=1 Tax=Podospora appendiculata TaxID=314037 RepID=A0AAE1C9S3_9PEZI|nr:hypothetical protein B0T22DRAFT_441993 [Podospora appendiculata]
MYIYSKTHGLRQTGARGAKGDPTSVLSPEQASLSQSRSQSQSQSPFQYPSPEIVLSLPSPSSSASPAVPGQQKPKSRRRSLPFSFPPLFFQPNISSASLAPSTAEGRPIPLDDTITAHRTSALQKLNSTYPSTVVRGHRYAKSTGAQSSTYSQPVLVRTYSGPSPSQTSYSVRPTQRYRPSSGGRGASRRVPLPLSSRSGVSLSSKPSKPSLSGPGTGGGSNGYSIGSNGNNPNRVSMPHHKSKKSSSKLPLPLPLPLAWQWQAAPSRQESDEAKLPPLEAFSFKSFLADMEAQGGESDIGADLDRIAEICARSRYSLSNQYEVHVTPHGSGVSFVAGGGSTISSSGQRRRGHNHSHSGGGPTLQAINSDEDESAARSGRKRRGAGGRRRSAAYGTLETIMSSSRSSEEDKTKKKSAAELTEEVRGRAAQKAWDNSTGSGSASTANGQAGSQGGTTTQESVDNNSQQDRPKTKSLARKKSAAFATAVMDSSRSTDAPSLRSSASALLSEPALPQTSNSHLGVRSGPDSQIPRDCNNSIRNSQKASRPASSIGASNRHKEAHLANELPGQKQHNAPSGEHGSGGVHLGWGSWIPWRGGGQATIVTPSRGEAGRRRRPSSSHSRDRNSRPPPNRETPSHAEGSLRQLLKAVDGKESKGKAVLDRAV